jgi:hypothetical protein
MGPSDTGQGQMTGSCEHGSESSSPIKWVQLYNPEIYRGTKENNEKPLS